MVEHSLATVLESEEYITRINSRYSVIHNPIDRLQMCLLGTYPYHVFPTIYTLNSTVSLERSGVTEVQRNLNFALFGQGVLIGFVDTGIEYQHEAFRNLDGSTRIFSIWDQTVEGGSHPEGFAFGSEYNKTMINRALVEENPLSVVPSVDENGHGTMLAGIAAGSKNNARNFSGVASEAELVVVKLLPAKRYNKAIFSIRDCAACYLESNILMGIEYLTSVARRLNRPMVICIGLGSSQGAHDGYGTLSTHLNNLSSVPRLAVTIAAGNEGNSRRHYKGEITAGQSYNEFELRVGQEDKYFSMEIWQKSPGRLSVELLSPTGERVQTILPRLSECREHNFVFEDSKIYINNFIMEEESGEQLILIRFEEALSGVWKIRANNIDNIPSEFDAWLPAGDIISMDTYFLQPDPYTTITSPANSRNTLSITAYNQTNNSILLTSSRGYSASGTVEPDLAAPGFSLPCPTVNNTYGNATGTGAASAHTAGAVAMLLEWAVLKGNYTTITGRDISRLLVRGARRDSGMVYPNPIWGYGQLDLMGLFRGLI